MDTTTIRNCWQKAGILPDLDLSPSRTQPTLPISSLVHPTSDTVEIPAMAAEMHIREALNHLEATGALQRLNRMDITELLNLAIENHNIFNATDEDIFESVMDAKKAQERNTGGDDSDADVTILVPGLTCRELLQAALMLQKHVRILDDPFAHKFKVMLGSFSQWTCTVKMQGLKDTKVTDYFSCK